MGGGVITSHSMSHRGEACVGEMYTNLHKSGELVTGNPV